MSLQEQRDARLESGFLPIETGSANGPLVSVQVDVTPQEKENAEGDIVLLGHLGKSQVEVVFKRNEALRPLLTLLTQMLRGARAKAVAVGEVPPNVSELRLPLQVDGAWRVRLHFDADDMPVRHYQLVANRWRSRSSGRAA